MGLNSKIPPKKFNLSVSLNFTTSKFAAYLILAIGSVFAFLYKDAATLLATFSAASAVIMVKTYTTSKTEQAHINSQQIDPNQQDV